MATPMSPDRQTQILWVSLALLGAILSLTGVPMAYLRWLRAGASSGRPLALIDSRGGQ